MGRIGVNRAANLLQPEAVCDRQRQFRDHIARVTRDNGCTHDSVCSFLHVHFDETVLIAV